MLKCQKHLIAVVAMAIGSVQAAGPIVEHTISCQPSFQSRAGIYRVVLTDSTNIFEAMWWNSDFFLRRFSIDTNQVYAFTFIDGADTPPPGPRIVRVYQDAQRVYDASWCDLHQRKMELRPQRIAYGLYMPPDRPSSEDEQEFPHRHRVISGGCVVLPNQPQTQLEFECDECTAAFESWWGRKDERALEQLRRSLTAIHSHLNELDIRLRSSRAQSWSREAIALRRIVEEVKIEVHKLRGRNDPTGSALHELDKLLRRPSSDMWGQDVITAQGLVRSMQGRAQRQLEVLVRTEMK
jgi:hypothetical protein